MFNAKSVYFVIFFFVLMASFALVGCGSSKTSQEGEWGTVTGTYIDAANSKVIAKSDGGEYIIPVDSYGRFSASLPVGVYTFYYRAVATGEKLILTNKTFLVTNNVTISVVDAKMIPQPKVMAVNVSLVNRDSVIIEWETDIESDGCVEYGTNELYGYQTYVSTELTRLHRVQLTALNPNTTYHFRIIASRHNSETAQTITQDYTFTTEN